VGIARHPSGGLLHLGPQPLAQFIRRVVGEQPFQKTARAVVVGRYSGSPSSSLGRNARFSVPLRILG